MESLYLITVLTKVIAIVFVFENFIVFVIVFKFYACIWTQVWYALCVHVCMCVYMHIMEV